MKTNLQKLVSPFLILVIAAGCSKTGEDPLTEDNNSNEQTAQWSIESIVPGGVYPAMAISSDGNIYVSYLDNNDGYVKVATRMQGKWTVSPVGKVSNSNGTIANGGISSIALDAADNPHLTYYDYGNAAYKYAKKEGDTWALVTIPLPNDPLMSYASPFLPWEESSLVIDKQSGTVHIALQMLGGLSGQVLGYWRSGLAAALIVDADGSNSGYQNAITLDANGQPVISYEDRANNELKCACWTGTSFTKESIAPMPQVYWRERITAIVSDNNNGIHLTYYGQGIYKYAKKSSSGWTISELTYQSGYPALSITVDSNGSPHIAMVTVDYGNAYRLKHAYLDNKQWTFENIADNINHCVIAVDTSNKLHIVFETDSGELKLASK